ncbi:uncharacterized protein [Argopecten irradians]|uniref:uncharacterized protein n=1 Tax=Argopecten irradians TaxID=31199 RepID=UPI00371CD7D0
MLIHSFILKQQKVTDIELGAESLAYILSQTNSKKNQNIREMGLRSICSDLITAFVIIPVMAGNYRKQKNGHWSTDGIISFIVFLLVFLGVVGILTFSKEIDVEKDKRLAVVFVLLSTIQVIGVLACIVLCVLLSKRGLSYIVLQRQEESVVKLQLVFLWIFGIGAGLFSAFLVGQQIQCKVFGTSIDEDGRFFWDCRGIFNVITIISLLTEMVFISYFSQFEMKRCICIRYVIAILTSANISIWLHTIIIDNEPFPESILEKHFGNHSNKSTCLQNDSIGSLINDSKQILGTCFLEFFLLSITILFEMWSKFKADCLPAYQDVVELNSSSTDEETPLLVDHRMDNQSRTGRTVYQLLALISSIGIGIAKIVGTIVWVRHQGQEMRSVMKTFDIIFNSVILIVNLIGFYCLAHYYKPDRKTKSLKISEYVYLSSAFGIIMLHFCDILTGLLSSIHHDVQDATSRLTLIAYAIALIQDYFQVVFLLQTKRCIKANPHSSIHLLDCVLLFLMVTNICQWMEDSFILSSYYGIRQVEKDVLGSVLWGVYHNILLPVSVFFRFSSALELYTTFKEIT